MFLLMCIIFLIFPGEAVEGAKEGMRVGFEVVLPSILPFSVLASAAVYSGSINRISLFFEPIFKWLNISPFAGSAFITSLIAGYPTGCKMACDMYSEELVDKEECEKMLCFVNNGGIIFALNVLGDAVFSSKKTGAAVFVVSALSALVTGMIFAPGYCSVKTAAKKKKLPFWAVVGKSIYAGGGMVVNIISSLTVFYALGAALHIQKLPLISGLWEITRGVKYAGAVNSLPLAAFFFSFGGFAVMAQSGSICSEFGVNMKYCIIGKVISSAASFFMMYALKETVSFDTTVLAFAAVVGGAAALRTLKRVFL